MNRILLVGCGNIGSRHLQGLEKLSESIHIDVVEPNHEAQYVAKNRLAEVSSMSKHEILWYDSIDELKSDSMLTIVSTQSSGRVDLIKKLLELGNSRFLIEKMVCQSKEEYDKIISLMNNHGAKGWVNTPRRYFEPYGTIKANMDDDEIISISVMSGNIGLGTNSIHLLDLFSWLTNDKKIELNGNYLLNRIFPNKRGQEFVEFGGTIIGKSSNESVLSITALPYDDLPLTISICGQDKHFIIDENNSQIFILKNKKNLNLKTLIKYQSDLTNITATEIVDTDNCILPTLEESYSMHIELFRIFNQHLRKLHKTENKTCPIT